MLRTIKSTKLGTRIVSYTAETTGVSTRTFTSGEREFSTIANASAGGAQLDLTFRNPFRRVPVVVASPGVNVGNGGAATLAAATTASTASVVTVNGSNANDVGQQHGFIVGNDSPIVDNLATPDGAMFAVTSTRRASRMIAGVVASGATITTGTNQFTVTSGGTGIFDIVFKRAFAQAPTVVVMGGSAGANARVESVTAAGCQVRTFSAADAATNLAFHFMALGSDALGDSVMPKGRAIQTQMRKPRLIHVGVSYSGGVPSLITANADVTLTDTGTGQLTINFAKAFARTPIVVAASVDGTARYCSVGANAVGSCRIDVVGNSGIAGDPLIVYALILGSDDAAEY